MAKNTKRISGANGLRALVSELEDVLTPAIVDEIDGNSKLSEILTGDYNISDKQTSVTTITFYAKTKDKSPREQSVKGFLDLIVDYMLEVGHKDFTIEPKWDANNPTDGIVTISLTADQTKALTAGRWVFDVVATHTDSSVTRLLEGIAIRRLV